MIGILNEMCKDGKSAHLRPIVFVFVVQVDVDVVVLATLLMIAKGSYRAEFQIRN